ncbi:MAG: type I 3-dehydroquinate dehydratase [Dehalococcoidales bacterium]|nr:type I 3-dehydroquinate dehydratase [Dehalococcoidales bacterium]
MIKPRAGCLISYHDLIGTPSYETLVGIVNRQLNAGADICKVVTTALEFEDNLKLLKLINEFAGKKIVALAMGDSGRLSRSTICI